MGSMTKHAYRLLFTATNVRLGVWLPHPAVVRDARRWIDFEDARRKAVPGTGTAAAAEAEPQVVGAAPAAPAAVVPAAVKLFWDRQRSRTQKAGGPAVGPCAPAQARGEPERGALWYRTMQPTLGLLWAEAAGRLSYRATWMYVTDGGHYDNLGLVEALRRGASNIVVLDASGDKADTWFTLGGAIALARSDAGVDIQLDPTAMVRGGRGLAPGQVVRPVGARPVPRRPSHRPGSRELPAEGEIWVCKLGWWAGAPWDVRAYAKSHSTYPCDTRWSSCTTPPSSRPTRSSARPRSGMRPETANPSSNGRPRRLAAAAAARSGRLPGAARHERAAPR